MLSMWYYILDSNAYGNDVICVCDVNALFEGKVGVKILKGACFLEK